MVPVFDFCLTFYSNIKTLAINKKYIFDDETDDMILWLSLSLLFYLRGIINSLLKIFSLVIIVKTILFIVVYIKTNKKYEI